jgi:vanillate O-demethylase monooxygenase subunit
MFPKNTWYVAAWDHEIKRLRMQRRIILGDAVVLYRKSDGSPAALEDRCCHRHAQLSHGRLMGDNIECAYHGFRFSPDGRCVHIPTQDKIPTTASVRSFPVVEKYHWIWIWMGDPALADEDLIPDFGIMDHPDWNWKGETLYVEGNYMLVVENLMDLTHLPTLHRTTLADMSIPEKEYPTEYKIEKDGIEVNRWAMDTAIPGYFRVLAGWSRETRVDRWMNTFYTAPSFVLIDIGAAEAGSGARDGNRDKAVTTWNLNAITPETESTSHYFWSQAQDFSSDDPTITDLDFELVHTAFQEDLLMIKGQQENMALAPHAFRFHQDADRAGVHARGMVDSMIKSEMVAIVSDNNESHD